jgi:hypothetical protein
LCDTARFRMVSQLTDIVDGDLDPGKVRRRRRIGEAWVDGMGSNAFDVHVMAAEGKAMS